MEVEAACRSEISCGSRHVSSRKARSRPKGAPPPHQLQRTRRADNRVPTMQVSDMTRRVDVEEEEKSRLMSFVCLRCRSSLGSSPATKEDVWEGGRGWGGGGGRRGASSRLVSKLLVETDAYVIAIGRHKDHQMTILVLCLQARSPHRTPTPALTPSKTTARDRAHNFATFFLTTKLGFGGFNALKQVRYHHDRCSAKAEADWGALISEDFGQQEILCRPEVCFNME